MHLPGDLILHDLKLPVAGGIGADAEPRTSRRRRQLLGAARADRRATATKLPAWLGGWRCMLKRLEPLGVRVFLNATVVDARRARRARRAFAGGGVPGSRRWWRTSRQQAARAAVAGASDRGAAGRSGCGGVRLDAHVPPRPRRTIGGAGGGTKLAAVLRRRVVGTEAKAAEVAANPLAEAQAKRRRGSRSAPRRNDGPVGGADDGGGEREAVGSNLQAARAAIEKAAAS